ncbi:MAG: hypothetical protein KC933_37465 [Myxococcales bacterium]|nr:hypothetical protein [Myxococcales bacterium]MCA9555779.1 hypothetical protein [Myxococcales bacterium]
MRPSDLPPLSPQSERIQRHAGRMGILRVLGAAGAPPMARIPDFPEPTFDAPVQLREDDLIAFALAEPRPVEPPPEVERWMTEVTPQFFLRNTWRVDRPDTDIRQEFEHFTWLERVEPPAALVQESFVRPGPEVEAAPAALRSYLAERAALMVEPWHLRFGRPDPG